VCLTSSDDGDGTVLTSAASRTIHRMTASLDRPTSKGMVTLPRCFTSTDSELVPGLSLNAPRKLLDLIVDFCGVVRWSGVADPPVGRLFHR
jgi:hypothetical protein